MACDARDDPGSVPRTRGTFVHMDDLTAIDEIQRLLDADDTEAVNTYRSRLTPARRRLHEPCARWVSAAMSSRSFARPDARFIRIRSSRPATQNAPSRTETEAAAISG